MTSNVTPEDRHYRADVRGMPAATFASTLDELRRHVRELIILGANLPDDAKPEFTFHYHWPVSDGPGRIDEEMFEDPDELIYRMEDDLSVDEVRGLRIDGSI